MAQAGKIVLNIDTRSALRAGIAMRHAFGLMEIALLGRRLNERERAQRRYDLGCEIAADHPDFWECFCVTTNEGRCRVISRPRGVWS